jgi:hypothetical protein
MKTDNIQIWKNTSIIEKEYIYIYIFLIPMVQNICENMRSIRVKQNLKVVFRNGYYFVVCTYGPFCTWFLDGRKTNSKGN